jgi:DNA-directed RNA polymerase specialized sigma24 family protein
MLLIALLPIWPLLTAVAAVVSIEAARTREQLRRALAGDRQAMQALVHRLFPVVHARTEAFVRRRATGRIDASDGQDVAQDVWLALLRDGGRALMSWDPDRGMSLEGYVGLLTQRELWGRVRAASADKRGSGQAGAALDDEMAAAPGDPEQTIADRDLLERVTRHLAVTLPERGRLVFSLLYEDECSPTEAAATLGVNLQVVYNWQFKIRQLAQAYLEAAAG